MPIQRIYTRSRDDAEAQSWLAFLRRRGCHQLSNLAIERVVWIEGRFDGNRLMPLFVNPVYQTASSNSALDPAQGPILEIGYRPAVTDPETPSILTAAHALGESGVQWARLSKRYQFFGIDDAEARALAGRFLFNKVVQRILNPQETVFALRPTGEPDKVTTVSLAGLTEWELQQLSAERSWYAPLSQMKVIQSHEASRGPHTDAEIEILVQSWSDHCYHTTWKSLGLLKKLSDATARIHHPLVVSAFKDNAGGLEFYDGWVITLKGETHNFPSSIAPFGGVATKHGGVIRDTLGFGKGAYPIGGTTLMGTMDPCMPEDQAPPGSLHPQLILSESVRATSYYMNPMGIPMMHAIYRRHPGYAKCLALGHSVGLIPKQYAVKEDPHPGDIAVLVGGETGRDGIHGATASSTRMTAETLVKESASVQIGHPITERRFTSAIPLLRDAGCVRSISDLGAGGISCAAGEMGAETGVRLDLDAVPLKDRSLAAWEILLSESQERMLLAVPPEKMADAEALLKRYEVDYALIGEFTASSRLEAFWRGEKVVDLEMSFLWGACPIDRLAQAAPVRELSPLSIPEPATPEDWSRVFRGVLGHYHCADQSAAGSRFDSTVQGRTRIGPYGGKNHRMPSGYYAGAPIHGKDYGFIATLAINPFYGEIDPAVMARLMVIEAVTKAVVAGASYREMALCDNFYTPPARPDVASDLVRMVEAIADYSVELGIPFISGKDSSSGTFESADRRIDAPLTLAVAALGRTPDVRRVATKDFKRAGNQLLWVGHAEPDALGGSVYADTVGQRGDRLFDACTPASIRALWDALLDLHSRGAYVSASAIAEGGVALRVFEAAYGSGLGARIDLAALQHAVESRGAPGPRRDGLVFGEFIGSVLLEVPASFSTADLPPSVPNAMVGEVISEPRLILAAGGTTVWQDDVANLEDAWSHTFREALE
jgi:phosphoribosylformylglycinamidine synthase subunit PurSL